MVGIGNGNAWRSCWATPAVPGVARWCSAGSPASARRRCWQTWCSGLRLARLARGFAGGSRRILLPRSRAPALSGRKAVRTGPSNGPAPTLPTVSSCAGLDAASMPANSCEPRCRPSTTSALDRGSSERSRNSELPARPPGNGMPQPTLRSPHRRLRSRSSLGRAVQPRGRLDVVPQPPRHRFPPSERFREDGDHLARRTRQDHPRIGAENPVAAPAGVVRSPVAVATAASTATPSADLPVNRADLTAAITQAGYTVLE